MSEKRGRRRRIVLLALAALVLLGFTFRRPALVAVADFLHVGEAPVPADFAYIMGGDVTTRPPAAARLYLDGYVPRIVLPRIAENQATAMGVLPNEADSSREFLVKLGVPDSAIVVLAPPGGARNTAGEALVLRDYIVSTGADAVIVVTNDFHTRRARWNLRRKLEDVPVDLTMFGVSKGYLTPENWWQLEEGVVLYLQEYLKFVHNFVYR